MSPPLLDTDTRLEAGSLLTGQDARTGSAAMGLAVRRCRRAPMPQTTLAAEAMLTKSES